MALCTPHHSDQLLLTHLQSQGRDLRESATYWLTVRDSWCESSFSASKWLSEDGVLEDLTECAGKELRSQFLKENVLFDGGSVICGTRCRNSPEKSGHSGPASAPKRPRHDSWSCYRRPPALRGAWSATPVVVVAILHNVRLCKRPCLTSDWTTGLVPTVLHGTADRSEMCCLIFLL